MEEKSRTTNTFVAYMSTEGEKLPRPYPDNQARDGAKALEIRPDDDVDVFFFYDVVTVVYTLGDDTLRTQVSRRENLSGMYFVDPGDVITAADAIVREPQLQPVVEACGFEHFIEVASGGLMSFNIFQDTRLPLAERT